MSATLVFDTLAYAKKLIDAGVPPKQAEIQAETMVEVIEERIATKKDLKELRVDFKRDMKELEMRLAYQLTLRLGAMIAVGITVLGLLLRL